jgi:NADH-quinone oxidoreductase subunit K
MEAFLQNPMNIFALGVLGLLGMGIYGLLITRNMIKMVAVLQILVKSAVLALVLAGKAGGNVNLGQSLAATVIVADTIVAVIGLALGVQIQRRFGTADLKEIATLKG